MSCRIETNGRVQTKYFIDGRLRKQLLLIDSRVIDWIMPQLKEYRNGKDRAIEFYENIDGYSEYFLGERVNNQLNGRAIELNSYGGFKLQYHKNGERAVGSYVSFDASCDSYIGEHYYGDNRYVEETSVRVWSDGQTAGSYDLEIAQTELGLADFNEDDSDDDVVQDKPQEQFRQQHGHTQLLLNKAVTLTADVRTKNE